MHELAGSIFGRPQLRIVGSGAVRGQPSSVGAGEPLTRLHGDSRANGCVVAPDQASLLERGRSACRVIGGVRYDSRRPGLRSAFPLTPESPAQSWPNRMRDSATRRCRHLRAVGTVPDGYVSATEDVRGWVTRQRLFQLRGEEGQRSETSARRGRSSPKPAEA